MDNKINVENPIYKTWLFKMDKIIEKKLQNEFVNILKACENTFKCKNGQYYFIISWDMKEWRVIRDGNTLFYPYVRDGFFDTKERQWLRCEEGLFKQMNDLADEVFGFQNNEETIKIINALKKRVDEIELREKQYRAMFSDKIQILTEMVTKLQEKDEL